MRYCLGHDGVYVVYVSALQLFHRSQYKLNHYFENIPFDIFCQSNHILVNFYFKLKPKFNWRNAVVFNIEDVFAMMNY